VTVFGAKSALSIVIPAHDPGPFLAEALRSVVSQEYVNWECVVVDDGSSEDLSWVDEVDPRIRRIRRANRGPSAARNAGVAATNGDFVAFLDADDIWRPDKLSRQITSLKAHPDSVLCHTGAELIDTFGKVLASWPDGREIRDYAHLLKRPVLGVSGVVVRRVSLLEAGGWNVFLQAAEDSDLWLRLILLGTFIYDDEPLWQYRIHSRNASFNAVAMAEGIDQVLRQHEALARQRGDRVLLKSIRSTRQASRRGWGATAYDQARTHLAERRLRLFGWRWLDALRLNPRYTLVATGRYLLRLNGPQAMDRN